MNTLNDYLKQLNREQKPRTKFQKQYAKTFVYKGRTIIHFPGRVYNEIPRAVRITPGIKPSDDTIALLHKIWQLIKTEGTNYCTIYCTIDDFIILGDLQLNDVANWLIWLVKNNQAILNVDRWGRACYISFKV